MPCFYNAAGLDESASNPKVTRKNVKLFVIDLPVKRSYLKALSDGYLQEVKRLASKKISIRQGGFKH